MQNKITIEEAVKQINEGFSSIYSKDDVLHLLSVIETKNDEFELTDNQISNLSVDIANELNSAGTDIVDDYELSMSYREVELDSIGFDHRSIRDIVDNAVTHFFNSIKKEK